MVRDVFPEEVGFELNINGLGRLVVLNAFERNICAGLYPQSGDLLAEFFFFFFKLHR